MPPPPNELWPGNSSLGTAEAATLLASLERPFAEMLGERGLEPTEVAPFLPRLYLPLAAWIDGLRQGGPLLVGISGAQGAGKSTLCAILQRVLEVGFGLRVVTLSIDDLYLTRAERVALSKTLHPLFITRGVPGTHDVALGFDLLSALKRGESRSIPAFDKAQDDRRPVHLWPHFEGPAEVILFEGWCVGVQPQKDSELIAPLNALEAEADPDGTWRTYVNGQLKSEYATLFELLDVLIMLKVSSFEHVFTWRSLQEQRLAASLTEGAPDLMSPEVLRRFIMHFERLTRAMLAEMPNRADLTLLLGEDHQVGNIHMPSRGKK